MGKTILFVDDERQILKAINRLFIDSDYYVFFAESGEEALQILKREKIDMIISDMRMPNMDGYQLLMKVKEMYPLTLRLILSGYAEEGLVFKALQNNLAKLYLLKPWDNQKFFQTIQQVFEAQSIIQNEALLAVINNIEEIPTIPNLYQRLRNLIEQEADIKSITKVIEEDPAIASKILHIANSAFYRVQTGSVNKAILYLGLTNIKNIALTSSVFNTLKANSKILSKDLLWQHSCICNKIVHALYERHLGKVLADACMSAGLLHDIGKIVLLNNFEEKYSNVFKRLEEQEGNLFVEVEKEIMRITHQEIGGYLLDWWELPQPIVESTLFHHDPLNERIINKELVCIVHLADYYSWEYLDRSQYTYLDERVQEFLGISKESCKNIVRELNFDRIAI